MDNVSQIERIIDMLAREGFITRSQTDLLSETATVRIYTKRNENDRKGVYLCALVISLVQD